MKRLAALVLGLSVCSACSRAPGQPEPDSKVLPPSELTDFAVLYAANCAGCHGSQGKGGAAIALGDPVYLAIADDTTLTRVTHDGVPGTAMPAFARSAGGLLTDAQVSALVRGIRASWARPGVLHGSTPPPYATRSPGDPRRGRQVYAVYCASCHGKSAKGDGPAATSLKSLPADLTTLAKRNGGKYPLEKVTSILRGQTNLVPHGDQEMPVWGPVFWRMSGGHEEVVQQRIANLNKYIESLQAK